MITQISELVDIRVGYQARKGIAEDLDAEFIILRALDVDEEGRWDFEGALRFRPDVNPERYQVHSGDVLLLARSQEHRAYYLEEVPENAVASNSFYILRLELGGPVLPRYLAWWLNAPEAQGHFQREQGMSTIPFLKKPAIANCPVHIPPAELQESIGLLMALRTRERALTQHLDELKEKLVQGICRRAVKSEGTS